MTRPIADRFAEKVRRSDTGCWEWMGARSPLGYGRFGTTGNSTVFAHRFAYELHRGAIPAGYELDHLCRNPSCVNPEHLEPVTHRENVLRGRVANRGMCRRGHVLSETTISPLGKRIGVQQCKVCIRERQHSQRERLKAYLREWRAKKRHTELRPTK